jgi:GT2 family glycosyltransferase
MKSISLVIALYNQVDYTRRCIESIVACTPHPYELILVDNASVDGTADYVGGLPATLIRNDTNLGCAKAWNQGIRASRGEAIGILNNDIVVTPGWLENLLDFMERGAHGIVCPSACEGPLDYDLHAYAETFAAACAQAVRHELYAPCMIIDRAVFDRIGLFDEEFSYGGCEDTDFRWRAERAGFSVAMTGSVLIHHFSMVTQNHIKRVETNQYWNHNMAHFQRKWGRTIRGNWFERRWTDVRNKWIARYERYRFGHSLVEKRAR